MGGGDPGPKPHTPGSGRGAGREGGARGAGGEVGGRRTPPRRAALLVAAARDRWPWWWRCGAARLRPSPCAPGSGRLSCIW
jgi:hypothetical protein